jgi:hypothetical protein
MEATTASPVATNPWISSPAVRSYGSSTPTPDSAPSASGTRSDSVRLSTWSAITTNLKADDFTGPV